MKPDSTTKLWMYDQMLKSRVFEREIEKVYMEGKTPKFDLAKGILPGELHISAGQEPCAVGVIPHLTEGDWVGSTHRSHHVAIAMGIDGYKLTAELFGKKTGLCGGYGGHMHLYDKDKNFSTTGIIGEGLPVGLGAALTFKKRGSGNVAIAYIGDGAVNQGAFHETLNLASVWQVPLVVIIENNGWAVSVPASDSTSTTDNVARAATYGIDGAVIENNDPYQIYAAAGEAIERARAGGGPSLIEIKTRRIEGHFMGDAQQYRTPDEIAEIAENDPIPLFHDTLIRDSVASASELDQMKANVQADIEDWIKFARDSEYPAPDDALKMVFCN